MIPSVLAETDHDPILALSDDTIPTQHALDAVLSVDAPVVTGYCNLDSSSRLVNLTKRPFKRAASTPEDYDFFSLLEVRRKRQPFRSWFTGMCLTSMSRQLWLRYPFETLLDRSSDFTLSLRLQLHGIPIMAHPQAFVHHVKERWNYLDSAPDKRLLVGKEPSGVRYDLATERQAA